VAGVFVTARLPDDLRQHYLETGLWDDTSLASLLVTGLRARPELMLQVWSKTSPQQLSFSGLESL
jgi:non-ribosomal peptide synthetase component E (peptide arylation enzyme)